MSQVYCFFSLSVVLVDLRLRRYPSVFFCSSTLFTVLFAGSSSFVWNFIEMKRMIFNQRLNKMKKNTRFQNAYRFGGHAVIVCTIISLFGFTFLCNIFVRWIHQYLIFYYDYRFDFNNSISFINAVITLIRLRMVVVSIVIILKPIRMNRKVNIFDASTIYLQNTYRFRIHWMCGYILFWFIAFIFVSISIEKVFQQLSKCPSLCV